MQGKSLCTTRFPGIIFLSKTQGALLCVAHRSCQDICVLGSETKSMLSPKLSLSFPDPAPISWFASSGPFVAITWEFGHSGVTSCGRACAGIAIDCRRGSIPLLLPLSWMETNSSAVGRVPFGYRINLRAALVKMHNHKLDNAIHSQSTIFPTCSPSFPYGVTFTQFITFLLIFQVSLKVMEFYFYYKSNKNKY